jgi:hypothetical protein
VRKFTYAEKGKIKDDNKSAMRTTLNKLGVLMKKGQPLTEIEVYPRQS